jgi:GntR family transcriptional repressor for pyruvate dehydrogenase complex
MSFHNEIATASGNVVLSQLLSALINIFQEEQRVILGIYGFREKDHAEHVAIFEALLARDADLAEERMRAHLNEVRDVLLQWTPAPTAEG